MANTRTLTIVMADDGFDGRIPTGQNVVVLSPTTAKAFDIRKPGMDLFVVAAATGLESVAGLVHEANSAHRLRALFARADVDCTWLLPMLERAGVRTLRNMLVHTSAAVPERVLGAWQSCAQDYLIADAAVADDRLFVRSCALERFEVGFRDIPALADMPESERPRFVVDRDGSYLHWDSGDIHVGLDMLRYALDPGFRAKANLRRLSFDRRFGRAVKALRLDKGLRQSDILGLSARQVSRIEAGYGVPRAETIRKLARAHGLDAVTYLDRVAVALSESNAGPLPRPMKAAPSPASREPRPAPSRPRPAPHGPVVACRLAGPADGPRPGARVTAARRARQIRPTCRPTVAKMSSTRSSCSSVWVAM